MSDDRPNVVILGGGFAGLNAAKSLKSADVKITIIDQQNHHLFQPLLYQVATAGLSGPDIAAPIRKVLARQSNATVLMDVVTGVDFEERVVHARHCTLPYDYLVIAAGMQNHYFGNDEWPKIAPGLKSLGDAFQLRRKILLAYEAAELIEDEALRQEWLTFVVIGAGPTGVEMAGALREIAGRTMSRNFRNFDAATARVFLLEGGPSVLGAFPAESLRDSAKEQLEALGVQVRLNTYVKELHPDRVVTADGEEIRTRTIVWAAGVRAASFVDQLGVEQDKAGRIVVQPDLTIAGKPRVFVVGDIAACTDANGVTVPGLAPAAMQMGVHAGRNIRRTIAERELLPYRYKDKGQMATIGRSKAVAMSGPLKLSGYIAWLAWIFIHLVYLVGFRNRAAVFMEWAWAYVSFQRSARIVVGFDREE